MNGNVLLFIIGIFELFNLIIRLLIFIVVIVVIRCLVVDKWMLFLFVK